MPRARLPRSDSKSPHVQAQSEKKPNGLALLAIVHIYLLNSAASSCPQIVSLDLRETYMERLRNFRANLPCRSGLAPCFLPLVPEAYLAPINFRDSVNRRQKDRTGPRNNALLPNGMRNLAMSVLQSHSLGELRAYRHVCKLDHVTTFGKKQFPFAELSRNLCEGMSCYAGGPSS